MQIQPLTSIETHSNPLQELTEAGQSIWIDELDQNLVQPNGKLSKLVQSGNLHGVTSNPTIFEHGVAESTQYDSIIHSLLEQKDWEVKELFEEIAVKDILSAAKILRPVYEHSHASDGYVCIEVAPNLAHDSEGTIQEARRLWQKIEHPNVMIKIPATAAGLIAIQKLTEEGININVTLLFSQKMYEKVADAYLRGLEARVEQDEPIHRISSVASFFVSRIDAVVDQKLTQKINQTRDFNEKDVLTSLLGTIAIANAKIAYGYFNSLYSSDRWKKLAFRKANPQRLLWASTGTKNKQYSDVKYVEELIGPHTVNTLPPKTLEAFEDHGKVRVSLPENAEQAREILQTLEQKEISLKDITDELLIQGIQLFSESFNKLLLSLERKKKLWAKPELNTQTLRFPIEYLSQVGQALQKWNSSNFLKQLWQGDSTLWTNQDESKWLGWLSIVDSQLERLPFILQFQKEIREAKFQDVVVLGMGGSSLCPEVLGMTFDPPMEYPELHVLDSTDPEQIQALQNKLQLEKTLFIVSSKSGSTLEPQLLQEYFFDLLGKKLGVNQAAQQFIAITDPHSKLEMIAQKRNYWKIFHGVPEIGGRYSALSDFGIIPAAAIGVNIERLLRHALRMAHSCSQNVPVEENSGAVLGVALGTLGNEGINKVTLVTSPEIWDMGAWLEQLLAESTGKDGKGLIPICGERLGPPEVYEDDRLFIYLRMAGSFDRSTDQKIQALVDHDFPVIQIEMNDSHSLGAEFFRWEFATAVAGSLLKINPFNQPDVEASKEETRTLMADYEKNKSFPKELPFFENQFFQLFTNESNLADILKNLQGKKTFGEYIKAHLSRIHLCDYFCILAYLDMNFKDEDSLEEIRTLMRNSKKVATCLGFGPRFLHSTGQLYKGGANTGVFLQITSSEKADLLIPGHSYSFGTVKAAQASGDLKVLQDRNRRCLRVHMLGNKADALSQFKNEVFSVLAQEV